MKYEFSHRRKYKVIWWVFKDKEREWEYLGVRDNGINEHITKFCPECGEKMDSIGVEI